MFSDITKTYEEPSFNIINPSSNSPGAFIYTSLNESVADISGNTVTIAGAGNTTITATQLATSNYNSLSKTAIITVDEATPNFTMFSVPTKVYGSVPFTINDPSSNSPGDFIYTSSNESVATISGKTVTVAGAGNTTITANQLEASNYEHLSQTATFTVSENTFINPVIVNNSSALLYYINETTAKYANIVDSLQIPNSLKTSSSKVLFANQNGGVKITHA